MKIRLSELKNFGEQDRRKTFTATVLLRSKTVKTAKNNTEFLVLEFVDNSGSMTAMCFNGAPTYAVLQDAPVGTAFEICASVDFFNGRPSPKIESARKLSDEETAAEMPFYEGVPSEPVSASELIKEQQDILARNGENERLRNEKKKLEDYANDLSAQISKLNSELTDVLAKLKKARKTVGELHDESTAELEKSISEIDEINRKVRANLDKEKADEDSKTYSEQYQALTTEIENIRIQKYNLLNNAELPLEGLSVEDKELTYNGYKWDNMSGAEQLKVATAIIRKINPECGFVLLDKLEQMDIDTLKEFAAWLEKEGLQAIATRVSSGDECSIIIEDGYALQNTDNSIKENKDEPVWKAGQF